MDTSNKHNSAPDERTVSSWSDDDLVQVGALVAAEQRRRAVELGDVNALIEQGFDEGFTSAGLPRDPWIVAGMLVCPGGRVDKSGSSHECGFVSIGDTWVWEHSDTLCDVVRNLPGPRPQMRSVSLVPVFEGLEFDMVMSRMRTGVHQMKSVRSFAVKAGEMVLVSARARKADHSR